MIKRVVFLILALFLSEARAQIPVERYRTEIERLISFEQKQAYWQKIDSIDQQILVKTKDPKRADSISIDNMIRTALMVEVHGKEVLTPNVYAHVMNLSHNNFGDSQLAFWPIIEASVKMGGGTIEQFYPAYVLESIGLTFYGYSFLRKEHLYSRALERLNICAKAVNVVEDLIKAFDKEKYFKSLKVIQIVGEWNNRAFVNRDDERGFTFKFIKLEDGNLYIKRFDSLHRLIAINQDGNEYHYRVENEPFGWIFKLDAEGDLKLLDEKNEVLIAYTKSQEN